MCFLTAPVTASRKRKWHQQEKQPGVDSTDTIQTGNDVRIRIIRMH